MPTVLEVDGYRFYFYANEGTEPPHVHVDKGGATAKVWLTTGEWAHSHGYKSAQERAIRTIVTEHRTELMERWNEFFGQ